MMVRLNGHFFRALSKYFSGEDVSAPLPPAPLIEASSLRGQYRLPIRYGTIEKWSVRI